MISNLRVLGLVQVILAGFCFGFLGVFGRLAFKQGVTPQELLGLRFLLATVILGIICWIRFGKSSFKTSWLSIFHFAILGVSGYAVFSSFYFIAIQKLSITLAVLLLYTFPLWVTVGAWIFLKEHLSLKQFLTIPLAFIGLILLIGFDWDVKESQGLLFGLGAAVSYAIYILLSRNWLKAVNPWIAVFYIQLFSGLTLFLMSFQSIARTHEILSHAGHLILGLAFICSVMAMTLFQAGLQKLKSWEASILSTSEPLMGISLATLFFNESLAGTQIVGAALVLLAFILISYRS